LSSSLYGGGGGGKSYTLEGLGTSGAWSTASVSSSASGALMSTGIASLTLNG
jgi:hypothetical protein